MSRAGCSVAGALSGAGHDVVAVWNRSDVGVPGPFADGACVLDSIHPGDADPTVILIAVSDDAIGEVAGQLARDAGTWLAGRETLVVHLSGCLSREVLSPVSECGAATGSLHPLRSFDQPIQDGSALRDVWCAVEDVAGDRLSALVKSCGGHPFPVNSGSKRDYHLAAAMSSNFLTALLGVAGERMARAGVDGELIPRIISDLVRGTLDNVVERGAAEALTGPIARGDIDVIEQHLATLEDDPEAQEAYRVLAGLTLSLAERAHPERRDLHERLRRRLCSS